MTAFHCCATFDESIAMLGELCRAGAAAGARGQYASPGHCSSGQTVILDACSSILKDDVIRAFPTGPFTFASILYYRSTLMSSRARVLLLSLSPPLVSACGAEVAPPPAAPAHGHHHDHHHGEHEPGPLVHRFESAEQWAKLLDDPGRDAWQRPAEVIAAMRISEGQMVADIGAGTGYFLAHLARAVGARGKVLGCDVEPDMVRYMSERAAREGLVNVEAKLVPLDDPGLPAGAVDRVLIVDTWHHIAGRTAYAAKLRSGLAPGGAVYVVDFTMEAKQGPPPAYRLRAEQIVDELTAGGLKASVIEETLPDHYIVVGRRE
jgi:SAM-dependent methyltransferase